MNRPKCQKFDPRDIAFYTRLNGWKYRMSLGDVERKLHSIQPGIPMTRLQEAAVKIAESIARPRERSKIDAAIQEGLELAREKIYGQVMVEAARGGAPNECRPDSSRCASMTPEQRADALEAGRASRDKVRRRSRTRFGTFPADVRTVGAKSASPGAMTVSDAKSQLAALDDRAAKPKTTAEVKAELARLDGRPLVADVADAGPAPRIRADGTLDRAPTPQASDSGESFRVPVVETEEGKVRKALTDEERRARGQRR